MLAMNSTTPRPPIEPLFSDNAQLWLRVWIAIQAVALLVGVYVMVDATGGIRRFVASPAALRSIATIVLLGVYHVVGFRAHGWMMRRPWTVSVFVPLGWALIVSALITHGAFSVLILGAILQGFIFLPFSWAIATLAVVVALITSTIIVQSRAQGLPPRAMPGSSLTIARVVGMLATGIMIGTVMLYIHRANRDSIIRTRLLRQLDDAQRDLAARSRDAGALEERQRLARDIHDTLAQGFTSVIKHLEAIELSFAADPAESSDVLRGAIPHLTNAQNVSRESLGEIRRLVWALRPPQLVDATLGPALQRIVAQWGDANAVATTCTIDDLPELQPDADVIFLRVTQEALSNVARHARAQRVTVALHLVDGLILLSVEDDGCGFSDDDDAAGTMGIIGMRERVRPFGGRVMIDSEPGAGTNVTVALPLAAVTSSS
jgi:signal transduction histidine kinase